MVTNSEHTSKQYDVELESVRERVLLMGNLVAQQVQLAMQVLGSNHTRLMDDIIAEDHRINALEVSIDESCTRIIARRQPTAGDLRFVIMIVKTITDLERIGDEAKKIAYAARNLAQKKSLTLPRFDRIRHVSDMTLSMLRQSLDAFARLDVSVVARVAREDEAVDEEFRAIIRQLVSFMMEDPRMISSALEILFAAKAIERIGDHAKNMAEYVVFMVEGRDVRHISAGNIAHDLPG